MRSLPAHDFRLDKEFRLEQPSCRFVALVDLESYPAFVAEKADRLDLLQHLCHEMDALTATMWEVPEAPLRLEFIWAQDESVGDSFIRRAQPLASGVIRSGGRLCLIDDAQLLLGSRQRRYDLARSQDGPGSHLLLLPPGVYAVTIFNTPSVPVAVESSGLGYTIVLTHHPHPAPRPHPVRLNGLLPFGRSARPLDHPEATPDGRDSHKMPR